VLDDHPVVSAQSQLSTCGDARPVVKRGKIMFSLSSVIVQLFFFGITENARSGFLRFLIFTTYRIRSRTEVKLRSGENTGFRHVSILQLMPAQKKNLRLLFPGEPQKHVGN
jgi:hypothetical protein